MEWIELYEKFYDMPHTEKLKLFDAIKETLYPERKNNLINMVDGIREVRFSNGLACIHCGSSNVRILQLIINPLQSRLE